MLYSVYTLNIPHETSAHVFSQNYVLVTNCTDQMKDHHTLSHKTMYQMNHYQMLSNKTNVRTPHVPNETSVKKSITKLCPSHTLHKTKERSSYFVSQMFDKWITIIYCLTKLCSGYIHWVYHKNIIICILAKVMSSIYTAYITWNIIIIIICCLTKSFKN